MILGTAGHIDHGKTTLVKALTGVDTDRLPEEKRRGITIELGFAPLALEQFGTIGIVDVPGHEAFVRTMVAGAAGIDLVLLVVAADEGVMPQTREHLAILRLLGVTRGVIALTKADLVDDDWLALVEEDVRAAAHPVLPAAPLIATSTQSGLGIETLRSAILEAARSLQPASSDDLFRLPVDRAFTIKGTGTVATGTVWSGSIARDEVVRVLPGARTARVRGIQGHGTRLDAAVSGGRAALALAGVDVDDVPRGSTLVTDPAWRATTIARADVSLIAGSGLDLRPRSWYRLHLGTSEVGVRVVARADAVRGDGEPFGARLIFDQPTVARAGDRFVLRTAAPLNTVGGGVITDPYAPRRARPWPAGSSASERVLKMLDEVGLHALPDAELPVRTGASPAACRALVASLGDAVIVAGGRIVARGAFEALTSAILAAVDAFHAEHPLEVGLPAQTARALAPSSEIGDVAIQRLVRSGAVSMHAGLLARVGRAAALDQAGSELADWLIDQLRAAGAEPPSVDELRGERGQEVAAMLRFLERRGDIVQVDATRYYGKLELESLLGRVRAVMTGRGELGPSALRDELGLSRKFLIPVLAYCDRVGLTSRTENGRVWRGT